MITTIIDDKHKKHKIVSQQYDVGTYVIIDNNSLLQFCFSITEVKYHKWLREHNKWIPYESSIL